MLREFHAHFCFYSFQKAKSAKKVSESLKVMLTPLSGRYVAFFPGLLSLILDAMTVRH